MKQIYQFTCFLICGALSTSTASWASQDKGLYLYPELQVSPRASERVEMEAKAELANTRLSLLPLQISAASTLVAGLLAAKPSDPIEAAREDVDFSRQAAIAVGAGWLAVSYYVSSSYRPYSKARSEITNLPKGTTQQELTRERIAEERIEAAGSLARRMMWASVATNFLASTYVGSNTDGDGRLYSTVAALASLTPLFFEDRWQHVERHHEDYKKKIYAPIAMAGLVPSSQGVTAGMNLYWSF